MRILAQETNNAALLAGVVLVGGWLTGMVLTFRRAAKRRDEDARKP